MANCIAIYLKYCGELSWLTLVQVGELSTKVPNYSACSLSLCADKVVSESFRNSQNENDMNYISSHHMKFLVFVLRRYLYWFSLNYVKKSGDF